MARIIFFTDAHVSHIPPALRTDSYFEEIIRKIDSVFEYANRVNADAVVFGGDLFHRKGVAANPPLVVTSLIESFMKSEAPVFASAGNHDMRSAGSEMREQPLYILHAAGALRLLSGEPVLIRTETETVSLNGIPYSADLDRDRYAESTDWKLKHKHAQTLINVYHQMVVPESADMPQQAEYVRAESLAGVLKGGADVVLTGHYHSPSACEIEGVPFINPGSLARTAVNEMHTPSLAEIITGNEGVSCRLVELPHAVHADAFAGNAYNSTDTAVNANGDTVPAGFEDIADFVKSLEAFDAFNTAMCTADDILEMMRGEYNMPEHLYARTRQYLESAV